MAKQLWEVEKLSPTKFSTVWQPICEILRVWVLQRKISQAVLYQIVHVFRDDCPL